MIDVPTKDSLCLLAGNNGFCLILSVHLYLKRENGYEGKF